jgi:hypothetical protein
VGCFAFFTPDKFLLQSSSCLCSTSFLQSSVHLLNSSTTMQVQCCLCI